MQTGNCKRNRKLNNDFFACASLTFTLTLNEYLLLVLQSNRIPFWIYTIRIEAFWKMNHSMHFCCLCLTLAIGICFVCMDETCTSTSVFDVYTCQWLQTRIDLLLSLKSSVCKTMETYVHKKPYQTVVILSWRNVLQVYALTMTI